MTVVPAGVTAFAFVIEMAVFCPPIEIHSIVYEYPVQSPNRLMLTYPKSVDDCNRAAKSAAEVSTGIDEYV